MQSSECKCKNGLISFILRISMAVLFAEAAHAKFLRGLSETVTYFQTTFAETWIPKMAITFYAATIPFVEVLILIWLLVGYKLKLAWTFTAFVLISLALGMEVAGEYGTTADNFFYVFLCCVGIYFAEYDHCKIDGRKSD